MGQFRFVFAGIVVAAARVSSTGFARPAASTAACVAHAQEAAIRSGLGVDVITRVMAAESRGHPDAVSPKGAIGCMQIMPATWAYLSPRYGLGQSPFDARMNMIGGALYLAELTRKFGLPGAFAAYNAGPARYTRYAVSGVPLPEESVAYAARLGGAVVAANAEPPRARWQEASLFIGTGAERRSPSTDATHRELATLPHFSQPPVPANEPRPSRRLATLFPRVAELPRDQR